MAKKKKQPQMIDVMLQEAEKEGKPGEIGLWWSGSAEEVAGRLEALQTATEQWEEERRSEPDGEGPERYDSEDHERSPALPAGALFVGEIDWGGWMSWPEWYWLAPVEGGWSLWVENDTEELRGSKGPDEMDKTTRKDPKKAAKALLAEYWVEQTPMDVSRWDFVRNDGLLSEKELHAVADKVWPEEKPG